VSAVSTITKSLPITNLLNVIYSVLTRLEFSNVLNIKRLVKKQKLAKRLKPLTM